MNDLRTAAQQALEAMEDHAKQYPHMQKGYTVDAITALKAALAQQAEPVESVGEMRLSEIIEGMVVPVVPAELPAGTKLYTTPPQRKPLTEEEIDRIRADCVFTPHEYRDRAYGWALHFARAVERAHGITDPQIADRLARHGIPMPEAPACPDCHGIGYDSSGQLCGCQDNPSFG